MRDILIILHRTILLLVSALVLQDTWAEESPEAGAEVPPDPVALLHEGRYEEALAALERIPQEHPRSYFLDRALFLSAEIHEHRLADPAAALAGPSFFKAGGGD